MNSGLRWKLILAFVLVFFAGITCGFFGAVHGAHWLFGHRFSGSVAEHMKRHLRWELRLTPQQMAQISPIIDRAAAQLEAKRQQTARDVHEIFEQSHREILPFLNDDQRHRLEEMERRHRHQLHRHGLMPPVVPLPD